MHMNHSSISNSTKNTNQNKLDLRQPIFLIGMMGSGKTTVGKALAKVLRLDFIDLDHEIMTRCGVTIQDIFDIEGEEGFRRREHLLLQELANREYIVIATGGGVVMREENRQLIKNKGFVIYIKTPLRELLRRLSLDKSRPLLRTEQPKERILSLLRERAPVYEEMADLTVISQRRSPKHIVFIIQKRLLNFKHHK